MVLTKEEYKHLKKLKVLLRQCSLKSRKSFMYDILEQHRLGISYLPKFPQPERLKTPAGRAQFNNLFWKRLLAASACFAKMSKDDVIAFAQQVARPRNKQEVHESQLASKSDAAIAQKALAARVLSNRLNDVFRASAQKRYEKTME